MRFENSFDVAAPIDEVYETLLDLDKVAPAMPGAQVTDHVGDDAYKVAIKVKLGPMTMNYRGDVEVQDKDPGAHRAKMHVKAREARGQGNATADVTMSLTEQGGGGTHATIDAEVQLAGKAAAMGRGLIEDVSAKLVDQFADNLQQMFVRSGASEEAEAEAVGSPPPASASASASPHDAFDAGKLAGEMASDRLRDPRTLGAVLLLVLLIWLIGRR